MANVLLLGLEHSLNEDLRQALLQLGHEVQLSAFDLRVLEAADADVIFTASAHLHPILAVRPEVPVVIASRLPEVSAWLDALQDGAADYCGAPFEATQIRWILNSTLGCAQAKAA